MISHCLYWKDKLNEDRVVVMRHTAESVKSIIFFDKKLFISEQRLNAQNDRVYALSIDDIPEKEQTVSTFQNKNSVMVLVGVGWKDKLPLKFVDKSVKINKEYYWDKILTSTLMPDIGRVYLLRLICEIGYYI